MTDKYFIVDIIQSDDSRYGEVANIWANPVEVTSYGSLFASESLIGAEHFFMPLDNYLIQSIITEQHENKYWTVNPDDFEDEYIFDVSENRRRLIHRHVSFFEMDTDSDERDYYIEIPDIEKKCDSIRSTWIQNGIHAHTSLRDYILERATEGQIGQFWAWLFEDNTLLDLMPQNLENIKDKYTNALAEFIGFCEAAESF